jgi:sugar phosphate isomerase/epimerase
MKVAAQLYTVREFTQTPEGIAETLKKVADIGYRYVHCSKLGPIEPERLKGLLEQNGLKCVVTHTDPERILEDTDSVIREHRIIGCGSVGMSIMPERYRGSLEGLQKMIADFRPAILRILDAGLSFHYHNHDIEFIRAQGRTLLDILLESLPEINLLMCAFWVQVGGGDPIELIRRYGKRIVHIHLKDMAFGQGSVGQGRIMTPVLEGNMNYRGIIEACRLTGVTQNLIVEQDTCQNDPFDCLKTSFENLHKLGLC